MHMICIICYMVSALLLIFERLIVKMSASESVPVVFDHIDVPEFVEGTFRVKCKHCQTLISGSTKATSNAISNCDLQVL